MRTLLISTVIFALAWSTPASAQNWVIDDNHSQATFTIEHIVGKVCGFFKSFHLRDKGLESNVRFDPDNPLDASFNIVLNTWTIDTGIERRDKHLSTADFFDSVNHPHITFKSKRIERTDDGGYAAVGDLTIKDVTKEVAVPFKFLGQAPHPMPAVNASVGAIEASLGINRLDYNVGDGKFHEMGLVGDEVRLTVYLEMFSR